MKTLNELGPSLQSKRPNLPPMSLVGAMPQSSPSVSNPMLCQLRNRQRLESFVVRRPPILEENPALDSHLTICSQLDAHLYEHVGANGSSIASKQKTSTCSKGRWKGSASNGATRRLEQLEVSQGGGVNPPSYRGCRDGPQRERQGQGGHLDGSRNNGDMVWKLTSG